MTASPAAFDYQLDAQIGFRLRCAHQRASGIFQDHMAPFALTPTQFSALVRLWRHPDLAQNQLGRMTAMDPATLQGVLSRLKERQLIAPRIDQNDRRRRLWRLSDKGRALIERALAAGPKVSAETLKPLSQAESETLIGLLERLG